jgi:hypothetical protein
MRQHRLKEVLSDLGVVQSCANDLVEVKTPRPTGLLQQHRSAQNIVAVLLSLSGVLLSLELLRILHSMSGEMGLLRLTEVAVLYGLLFWMLGGSLIYVIADIGSEKRSSTRTTVSSEPGHRLTSNKVDPLLLLIPSYKEEEHVIRQA